MRLHPGSNLVLVPMLSVSVRRWWWGTGSRSVSVAPGLLASGLLLRPSVDPIFSLGASDGVLSVAGVTLGVRPEALSVKPNTEVVSKVPLMFI